MFRATELSDEWLAGRLVGLVIVAESRFTRCARPRACQLLVVTSVELTGRQVSRAIQVCTPHEQFLQ